MNEQALFSDGSEWYVSPQEPACDETVRIRFRTAADDAVRVRIVSGENICDMEKERSEGAFDYYSALWKLGSAPLWYCFEVWDGREKRYYGNCGVSAERGEEQDFVIVPGFSTPRWAKGAVMYQIFTDRFRNGDRSNDVETGEYCYLGNPVKRVEDWYENPAALDVGRFYGGDLQGVLDKLDYLGELGVEVLYFNPLFLSPSNHKYDTQDYDYIDPHFGVIDVEGGETLEDGELSQDGELPRGGEAPRKEVWEGNSASWYKKRVTDRRNLEAGNRFFARFMDEVHRKGMRVILDGVFNHCGSFHKWMDRERIYENEPGYEPGAYLSAESPYRNYFRFEDAGEDANTADAPNAAYEGWWGFDTLPKLNYEGSGELEEEILRIAKKWVSPPYCADGWRLDVAADLGHSPQYNHRFWRRFRQAVKEANPDALILAEHYGSPREWLEGGEWDSVMNYDAFMEPVTWFLTGMEKHSDASREELIGDAEYFAASMERAMARMPSPSLETAMNELSNHDHSRFLTRTNHITGRLADRGEDAAEEGVDPAVMREAVVMQMTWVGAPTVYYGDEAGLCGFTDPDSRRTYPWGREDRDLIAFHREMIRIHKESLPLRRGSLLILCTQRNILAYGRFTDREQVVVIVHCGDGSARVTVPVWRTGVSAHGRMRRLVYSCSDGYTVSPEEYPVCGGEVSVAMGARSALVMKAV